MMTEKKRRETIIALIYTADRLLGDALRLNKGKNVRFGRAVVEAQLLLDDATVYVDPKQTLK